MNSEQAPTMFGDAKLDALFRRASHPTTPEEEARTAAVLFCRLLARQGALTLHEHPDASEPEARFVVAAKYTSWCAGCGASLQVGEQIAWAPKRRALCLECHRQGVVAR